MNEGSQRPANSGRNRRRGRHGRPQHRQTQGEAPPRQREAQGAAALPSPNERSKQQPPASTGQDPRSGHRRGARGGQHQERHHPRRHQGPRNERQPSRQAQQATEQAGTGDHYRNEPDGRDSERQSWKVALQFSPPTISTDESQWLTETAPLLDVPEITTATNSLLRSVTVVRTAAGHMGEGGIQEDFDAGGLILSHNDNVVVETERGLVIGTVVVPPMRRLTQHELPKVLRKVDDNDQRQRQRNTAKEVEAQDYCKQRIKEFKLPMKLIRAEYQHSGGKVLFYFGAENRVDFRELVKDLAKKLHIRVEMRQVGVRDEARLTGGIGSCGRELCCSSWLQGFAPVSIRMAKDQNLVLNPTKVSGQCGRLKCCLSYEQTLYHEARKHLPKVGKRVRTPKGDGMVQELDVPRRLVRVKGVDGSIETFPANLVTVAESN